MARYRVSRGGPKKQAAPRGGLLGCILILLLLLAFTTWALYLTLNPS